MTTNIGGFFFDRNPAAVKMAYTEDSIWRNRGQFLEGREAIEAFLTAKWEREHGYRLRKELFAFTDDKVRKKPSLFPPSHTLHRLSFFFS